MSVVEETDDIMMCCASCGIAGVDDVKLKKCIACYLVKYCSIKCQREHRSQHKKECKKRAAELRDEILFKQPESSHHGDCPICFLPLSLDNDKSSVMSCCSKIICDGCNEMRELEGKIQPKCPFCRHSPPKSQAEARKNNMKRVEANDPVAICVGDIVAHNNLSVMYQKGEGVEKDDKKAVHHLEQAAIGGHPKARHNLGVIEKENGRNNRAVKHWIIAANMGHDDSLENLKLVYREGRVSKEDFASALRGHQAAIDAAKSPQREAAEKWRRKMAARV
ncbi:hypothetical protein QTG54_002600 [Skeletonema marinoi]|uniref:MYND-type domain-containing protein n=1 Tax=Skeletonema marinoi TaxID=267567 RepID=A0AAD8YLE5_9STRA|nr:hypothetical protein QTG54_002600 [Skeletonema marinoi]